MSEELSFVFGDHFVGCGFCGYIAPAEQGWKDCCPKMAHWLRRVRDWRHGAGLCGAAADVGTARDGAMGTGGS